MLFDTLLLFIYFLDIKYMFKQKKSKMEILNPKHNRFNLYCNDITDNMNILKK